MMPQLLVLCGPTASGKTALAVDLAQQFNGEVVSADSMQIYRHMDIGTAKPTTTEMAGIVHHMLDVADPQEPFSVAKYVDMASACVDDILSRGKLPIVAGGTGLYIDNLLAGRTFAAYSGEVRSQLQQRLQTEGLESLRAELQQIDPERHAKLSQNDEKRILRALEVWHEMGTTITEHDARSMLIPPRYEALHIALNYQDRAHLRQRIDQRVDTMMGAGLWDEVSNLLSSGIDPTATAMQAIGYKEFAGVVQGDLPLEVAVEQVKIRSRQYAKRQLSWFRRRPETRWILWDKIPDLQMARQKATAYMEEFGLL